MVLNFLKKKNKSDSEDSLSEDSLGDLPPAPKPHSLNNKFSAQNQAEPYIPPIPESDMPAPTPPARLGVSESDQEINFVGNQVALDEQKNLYENQLDPLPDAPNIPPDLLNQEPKEEVLEPKPINSQTPVNPKDIDPRDRFDDLINLEETLELPAPEQNEPIPEPAEEIQQPNPITQTQESNQELDDKRNNLNNLVNEINGDENSTNDSTSNSFVDQNSVLNDQNNNPNNNINNNSNNNISNNSYDGLYNNPYNSFVNKENNNSSSEVQEMKLPSADELFKQLSPVLNKNQSSERKLPDVSYNQLPSFSGVEAFEPLAHTTGNDPEFELPDISMNKYFKKELSLFVSVDNYALVNQSMKKLLKFFSQSSEMLGSTDRPEKIQILKELYKELNSAQKSLMEIDKKIFEEGS